MKRHFALSLLALFALTALAEEQDSTASVDDPAVMKALAARLGDEARDIRSAAEVEHARAQNDCWKKFLVSRCLDEAGQRFRDEKLKAAQLESRSRAIERELKRREIAEKDARRSAEDAARRKP
jgi:hypothetical protein